MPKEKAVLTQKNVPPTVPAPKPQVPAAAVPVNVSIDAAPWAQIEISGGSLTDKVQDTTPARLSLAPGRYSVVFKNPDFQSFTQTIEVTGDSRNFRFQFRQLSPERLVDSLVK